MEDLIPGASHLRPVKIEACVARSAEMAHAERDLMMHSLVAVAADSRAPLSRRVVKEAVSFTFGLRSDDFEVDLISRSVFLLTFSTSAIRNSVFASAGPLLVGRTRLGFMPWTRKKWATTGKMLYRALVCIEGIPRHAWQVNTVRSLFDAGTMIGGIDDSRKRDEEESACFCLWVWSLSPTALAKSGTLRLEEPVLPPESEPHYPELNIVAAPVVRSGPAEQLKYEVIIHLDEVWDFSPPMSRQPSFGSYDSNEMIDEIEEEWPEKHQFAWTLGVLDGCAPTLQRRSALDRLGARGPRDRSPPSRGGREGGSSGGDSKQANNRRGFQTAFSSQ